MGSAILNTVTWQLVDTAKLKYCLQLHDQLYPSLQQAGEAKAAEVV